MSRISRIDMLMKTAQIMAHRSTCMRAKVGAIIAIDGRIVSTGYAGAPSGIEHCHPGICNDQQPCTRTVHAEANAIAFAARNGVALDRSSLYCTYSPCLDCAKLIINAGIVEVYFEKAYRKKEGIELLHSAGVISAHWKESELPELRTAQGCCESVSLGSGSGQNHDCRGGSEQSR